MNKILIFAFVLTPLLGSCARYVTHVELNAAVDVALFCTEARSTYVRVLENCANGSGTYIFVEGENFVFRRLTPEERTSECRHVCFYEQTCRVSTPFVPVNEETGECIEIIFTESSEISDE